MKIGRFDTHPACDLFPVMTEHELAELARDIREHGLRCPIVLSQGRILDGRNRLLACERAGIEPRFEEWRPSASAVAWIVSMNLHRRHLDPSQRAMVAARLLDAFEAEARERRGRRTDLGARMREGEPGKASEKAAAVAGVSARTIEHAKAVLRQGSPALVAAVEQGRVSVSAAAALALSAGDGKRNGAAVGRRVATTAARQLGQAGSRALDARRGRFGLICACARWEDRKELERYRRVKVDGLAAANATAILWTTSAGLLSALRLLAWWGLEYVTNVVCTLADARDTPFVRERHDLLLFGAQGDDPPLPAEAERPDSVIALEADDAAARRSALLGRIERMFPGVEKVELFAPSPRDGWAVAP